MPEGTTPSVTSVGFTVKVPVLHIVVDLLFITGIGLTVTVTVNVEPVHVPDVGVTV